MGLLTLGTKAHNASGFIPAIWIVPTPWIIALNGALKSIGLRKNPCPNCIGNPKENGTEINIRESPKPLTYRRVGIAHQT
jgi:hypothetical protein